MHPIDQLGQKPGKTDRVLCWSGFPRLWKILGHLLPKDVHDKQFIPPYEDLYQDYLLFLHERRRSWLVKAGLNVLFAIWVAKLFKECFIDMFKKRE